MFPIYMEKLYLRSFAEQEMNIHIRRPVEFEKCLDHNFGQTVSLTRQRMTVQQLLDQREDNTLLIKHLEPYCQNISALIQQIKPHTTLVQQPCFSWSIDHEKIQTACWLFEAIVPRVALAQIFVQNGYQEATKHEFKAANRLFKKAETLYIESQRCAEQWTWKMPNMSHKIVRADWHIAQQYITQNLQHLCFIGVGLQNASSSTVLKTLATRAMTAAAKSFANWQTPEAVQQLQLADGLRHMFRSNVQWDEGKYGHSIHTLQTFCQIVPETFPLLQEEFEKVPFLLQERITTNNGAYFDPVEAAEDNTIEEIMQ